MPLNRNDRVKGRRLLYRLIVVPILACLFMRKLATHSTTAAPELSMQLSMVYKVVN